MYNAEKEFIQESLERLKEIEELTKQKIEKDFSNINYEMYITAKKYVISYEQNSINKRNLNRTDYCLSCIKKEPTKGNEEDEND